jgi:hypothetical protein
MMTSLYFRQALLWLISLSWVSLVAQEPYLHVGTDFLPAILVRGVDVETRGEVIWPEYGSSSDDPFTVKATGMPPGLRFSTDRTIIGTPTRSGLYRVTLRLTDAQRSSPPALWVVQVVDEPQPDFGPGGRFMGIVQAAHWARHPLHLRAIRLDVEVTPTGAFSGSMTILGQRQRYAGQLQLDPEDETERHWSHRFPQRPGGVPGLTLKLTQEAKPGFVRRLTAVIEIDSFATERIELRPRLMPTDDERKMLKGRHNLALMDNVHQGIASLAFTPGLEVILIGTLADETAFITSSPLLRFGSTLPGVLIGYDDGLYGNLVGEIELNRWQEPSFRSSSSGQLRWYMVERPRSRSLFPGMEINFAVVGNSYVPPAPGALILSGAPRTGGNAQLTFKGGVVADQPFTLTSRHQALFPRRSELLTGLRLDFYAPTGFFSGRFEVLHPLTGARTGRPPVPFRGFILQPENMTSSGFGIYQFPSDPEPAAEPPTTWQTSPLLPGYLELMPLSP